MVLQLILFWTPLCPSLNTIMHHKTTDPEYTRFINIQKVSTVCSYGDVNTFMTVKNRGIQQLLEFS